jgi:predicted alpha/beta-hydrolase family hydrolase
VAKELTVRISETIGEVDALLEQPPAARCLLVLAHGAGGGMRHAFMDALTNELAACGVATFRHQFPYKQRGRGSPDPPAILTATVRAAIIAAADASPELPLLAGGKSLGGRMTSQVFAERLPEAPQPLKKVRGLVFFGFPLHPPGKPGTKRAEHLRNVALPMLFLQGTRDPLADLSLLRPVCASLEPRATLHVVDSADHSFHVLKSSGTTDAAVLRQLAGVVASWAGLLSPSP